MAERSYFWPTTGTGDGPSGGYPATQVAELFEGLYPTGVLWGLVPSSNGGDIVVGVGKAIVQGVVYFNDAALTLSGTLPPSGQVLRGWVVVHGNASTRTVRLVRFNGAPNGPRPTLTQNASFPASGIWELPICAFDATSTGITILTGPNERILTAPRGVVGTAQITDGAITTPKIADGAVMTQKIADNAVNEQKIANNAVTTPKIANGAVTRAKMAEGTIGAGYYGSWVDYGFTRILVGDGTVNIPAGQDTGIFDLNIAGSGITSPPAIRAFVVPFSSSTEVRFAGGTQTSSTNFRFSFYKPNVNVAASVVFWWLLIGKAT